MQDLCGTLLTPGGGAWSRNGVIVFPPSVLGGLMQVPAGGGTPRLLSSDVHSGMVLAGTNVLYADGGTLYARSFDPEQGRLIGEPRVILRNEVAPQWRFDKVAISASATGVLVFQSRLDYNSQLVSYNRPGAGRGRRARFLVPPALP